MRHTGNFGAQVVALKGQWWQLHAKKPSPHGTAAPTDGRKGGEYELLPFTLALVSNVCGRHSCGYQNWQVFPMNTPPKSAREVAYAICAWAVRNGAVQASYGTSEFVIEQLEAFALSARNEALEEAAKVVESLDPLSFPDRVNDNLPTIALNIRALKQSPVETKGK